MMPEYDANPEAVIMPFQSRMNNRAIVPTSQVCPQCNGTRQDSKSGGKCQACQGAHKAILRSKAA